MAVSNREAYELRVKGISIPVVCADCRRTVWSRNAFYIIGMDEWYCNKCNNRLNDYEKRK